MAGVLQMSAGLAYAEYCRARQVSAGVDRSLSMGVRTRETQIIEYDVDTFVDDFRTRVRLPAPPQNSNRNSILPGFSGQS